MNDNVKHPKVSYAKRFAWPCPGEAGENINWSVQPYAKKMYGCREMKHIGAVVNTKKITILLFRPIPKHGNCA